MTLTLFPSESVFVAVVSEFSFSSLKLSSSSPWKKWKLKRRPGCCSLLWQLLVREWQLQQVLHQQPCNTFEPALKERTDNVLKINFEEKENAMWMKVRWWAVWQSCRLVTLDSPLISLLIPYLLNVESFFKDLFLSSRWSIILCYRRFSVNFCAKDRTDIRFAEDRETIGNMKSLLSVKTAAVVKETDFGPRHNLNVKENRFQMKTTKKKMNL